MIDFTKFEKSLQHLEAQYNNYLTLGSRTDLGVLEREAIAESVIQRFETCYDMLWKVLKRYLDEVLGVPEVPNSPKFIFKIASENKLLPSSIGEWLRYASVRINTAHDYSGDKAADALKLMDDFVSDAVDLYVVITGKTWE